MINFVNEFGERTDRGAVSATVESSRPMSFPYADATARILVDCDSAWMRFSESPNLTGGDIGDGYSIHSVTVRVDGNNAGRWRVRQPWGDKDLYFLDDSRTIAALSSGSTFDVALPWYGKRPAVFSWSLNRSSEMIRNSCDQEPFVSSDSVSRRFLAGNFLFGQVARRSVAGQLLRSGSA